MTWSDFFALIFLIVVLFGSGAFLWWLEKPERELRKKRLESEWKFFHTAGYVFEHIACNIDSYDSTLNRIETALIGIEMCHSYFVDENNDFKEDV